MDSIPRQLLLQVALLALNAFFAMTEIAVISLNPTKLKMLAEEGDKKAPKLLKMVEDSSGFLSTIQIGITLAGYLGSAFAAENFSDPLVMRPVIWLLSASTNGMLRLLHMKVEAEEEPVTEEEIRMMVDMGEARGAIESEEKEWIQNVFEFGDDMVRDVMIHVSDITAFPIDATDDEIQQTIRETGLSRYPVYGDDIHDVLGILNAREFLLDRMGGSPKPLSELLRAAYFVPDTLKATSLMQDMQSKKIHIAVVIDEYGDTAGLVTMEDLLEEIVGNIYDEFDPAEPAEIEELEPGLWRVSGSADVQEVAEVIGVDLPEDLDFDTLGGLVFSRLHTIPKDGAVVDVEAYGLHIHVERIEDRRIVAATVRRAEPAPSPEKAEEKKEK